ncbi:MAG: type VI secretion system baseplate subunit TssG, partial [Deltaproteobacteria bacterium]|nr:type VI secretion system baseplate subunit TssG [Deltaproteobacteria bacterium]
MATETRLKTPDLIDDLIANPKSFSYFQALKLLYLANHDRFSSPIDLIRRGLLINASIKMGFPDADLVEAKPAPGFSQPRPSPGPPMDPISQGASEQATEPYVEDPLTPRHLSHYPPAFPNSENPSADQDRMIFNLTVTFMGMCGSSSPLPPFYAQNIVDDSQNDDDSCKKLFDLITLPSYQNHAEAYFYNQLPFRLMDTENQNSRILLNSLIGQNHIKYSKYFNHSGDLAYLYLFATQSRTPIGLICYLKGRLRLKKINLSQCVLRWVTIPESQRLRLGGNNLECRKLGGGAVVGQKAKDRTGKFRL